MSKHVTVRLDLDEMLRSMPQDQTVPVLLLTRPQVANAVSSIIAYLERRGASYELKPYGTVSTLLAAQDVYFLAAQDYIYGVVPDPLRMRGFD